MRTLFCTLVLVATCAMAPNASAADAPKTDAINDYLVNIDAGAVSAAEILGMSGSLVSTVHATKDLVAALNTATGDTGKGGFGISFTPARSGIDAFSMSMERYLEKGNYLSRAWGNTTFSYAQNRSSIAGTDYRQDAVAMRTVLYMDDAKDPVRASHAAFKDESCREEVAPDLLLKAVAEERAKLGRELIAADREALRKRLKQQAPIREALIKDANKQAACIKAAVKEASAQWNTTEVALMVGQGWIRGSVANAERLSMARHISLVGAWGPNESSLLNLTVRRVDRELVLDSIATTPVYKSFTLAAVRYTVGFGTERDFYAIAEISNARKNVNTTSNTAFKSALGVDKKLGENMWLEFRLGRSRSSTGSGEQTSALMNLKIAPNSGLSTLGR